MSEPGLVRRLRAWGRACLLLVAAALPFEMTAPLARLGPLQISSVEVFLYLALAVWGLSLAAAWLQRDRDPRAWWRRAPEAHRAVLVWTLVLFASALGAPAFRGTAMKFALRSLGGILLYAAAADLLRGPSAAGRVAKALVAGALAAALLLVAEGRVGHATALLRPFHAQTFEVFGLVRASGSFQYPNIAAMYLEAALPVAFALGLPPLAAESRAGGAGRGRTLGIACVVAALLGGILATASRAGIGSAVVCLFAMGMFLVRTRATRGAALAAFAALLMLGLGSQVSSSALTLRLRFWKDADWYRSSISPVAGPAGALPPRLPPGGGASVTFVVQNRGALTWPHLPPSPVALSYHWLDAATGDVAVFDGERSALPYDVPPGGGATVRATVHAPQRPGRYLLWWDLVHERATWFSERGNPGLREPVEVRGLAATGGSVATGAVSDGGGRFVPSDVIPRRALWGAAVAAWRAYPLLGLGPDNFRHLSGRYLASTQIDDRLHANNLVLETLACLGTAGLLALAWVVVALARAARLAAGRPATRRLALGFGVGLGAYLVHGTLDYFFEFTPTYALWWLLGGMVVALGRPVAEAAA